ncbi:SIP domain-containing protein [Aeromicrobium sp. YIM 150415]|uniref:siderophore-interacting protein n=1 Tax=Aeromicrobium sp. YIM 150415 TaxID=2803912 RepID=UPI00196305E3|nr:siderophore-interacting protein [Aeromicrobium sp. YIM 150415]MBM9462986.1 SIP domain-containing protein [Aeromicrobium sp. YIM 150415]
MPRLRRDVEMFPISLRELEVAAVHDVTPGMRRITLRGEQLRAFTTPDGIDVPELRNDGFDDHVKVFVPGAGEERPVLPVQVEGHLDWKAPDTRPIAKDYTPRRWDPEAGELDLDFVRHEAGFATRWAENVRVGDSAWIAGPKMSSAVPHDVDWLLIAGDETALPAIGRLLEELDPSMPATVFVEVAEAGHEQELRVGPNTELTWLHRDGAEPGTTDLLEKAIRELDWRPGDAYCWVAGEAATLKPIRAHLVHERQVPRDCLDLTGYWRRTEVTTDDSGVPTDDVADDERIARHERLHELTDLTTPFAIRVAVTTGVIEALDAEPQSAETLASRLGLHAPSLRALLDVLVAEQIATFEAGVYGLDLMGSEMAGDGHSLEEYRLDGIEAMLHLSIADLPDVIVNGRPTRTVAERTADDPDLVASLRRLGEENTQWVAPSIAQRHDWTRYEHVVTLGPGAGHVLEAVLRQAPDITATLVGLPSELEVVFAESLTQAGRVTAHRAHPLAPLSVTGDVVLTVDLLKTLADADAALALGQFTARRIVLVERVADDPHDHEEAAAQLLHWCAHGTGLRDEASLRALVADSPYTIVDERDAGWGVRLYTLTR